MIKKTNKNSNRKRLTKGGRVKAAKGFPNPTKEPMEKKPIRKPIPQAPRKPIQPGIPSKNTRNIDDPRGPIDTKLPEPVLRAPKNTKAIKRGDVGTGTVTSKEILEQEQRTSQKRNPDVGQAPKPTQAPQTQQTSQAFPKAPRKEREEELYIGKTKEQIRRDAERYQEDIDAQTAQQTASNEVIENLPSKLGFKFSQEELDKIAANVQAAIDEGVLNLGTGGNGLRS